MIGKLDPRVTNAKSACVDQPGVPENQDDQVFSDHPDLANPDWQKVVDKANRAARRYQRKQRRAKRMRQLRTSAILLAAIVVIGGLLLAKHPWSQPTSTIAASTAAQHGTFVTATKQTVAPLSLGQPFANTPAAGWSDGAAGIAPPTAAAVGGYSAAQVAAAYAQVRQILIAGHLDPRVLYNHDLSAYLALYAPATQADLRKYFADPGNPSGGGEVTLVAKGFQLLPVPIKVNGTMSATAGAQGITVHTNYVFAFPFDPSDPSKITASWQIVAVSHVTQDFLFDLDPRQPPSGRGMYDSGGDSYFASMACTAANHGLLAPAYSQPQAGVPGQNDNTDALFDPNHSMNIGPGC